MLTNLDVNFKRKEKKRKEKKRKKERSLCLKPVYDQHHSDLYVFEFRMFINTLILLEDCTTSNQMNPAHFSLIEKFGFS